VIARDPCANGLKVMITGAAGFIGQRTVPMLLQAGCDVTAVDDLSAGFPWRLSPHRGLSCVELDLRDQAAVSRLCSSVDPDTVLHLAARHFIPHCQADPERTVESNVGVIHNLLAAFGSGRSRRVVFTSSAAAYAPTQGPSRESDPLLPLDVYGETKRAGERLLLRYGRHGTGSHSVRIARLFNVFGPGDGNPHLVPEILAQARHGDTLTIGNTTPRRDYVFIDDVVHVLCHMVLARSTPPVLNIGTGISRSVSEVVTEISAITGRKFAVVSHPERRRQIDRQTLCADISLLRATFPFFTPTPFRDGLRRALVAEGLLDFMSERTR
jgi:UDP-glucose 4-epimerase